MSPGSGRSATATGGARSRTPSYNDYEIVAANLLDGDHAPGQRPHPAYGLYIDPPLGRVGMTEAEVAQAAGRRSSACGR